MPMPKISIIIPVYNAESTIRRCLDSVVKQSFSDWECICIDDGSMDASVSICDEYAYRRFEIRESGFMKESVNLKGDKRITIYHKINGGVSSARNLGLDKAMGKWITFLDSDDAFDEGFLKSYDGDDAQDLIVTSFKRNIKCNDDVIHIEREYRGAEMVAFLENHLADLQLRTPWAKMFRRSHVGDLRFDEELHLGEDTLFCHQYYALCKSIRVDNTSVYLYTHSDTKAKYSPTPDYVITTFCKLEAAYSKLGIVSPSYNDFLYNWFLYLLDYYKPALRKWYSNSTVRHFYMQYFGITLRKRLDYYSQWLKTYK